MKQTHSGDVNINIDSAIVGDLENLVSEITICGCTLIMFYMAGDTARHILKALVK